MRARSPRALGVERPSCPIEARHGRLRATRCARQFAGREPDLTEENLQARIRGNLLMALSNKFGWLVLTTGNKSEMSVGYTTLYGDLAGGFAVIKDVPKTLVYRLCEWRNSPAARAASPLAPGDGARRAPHPIPASIIERAPSAELRPDQRDEDSLPPYEVLDRILEGYVELDLSREQLIAQGLPEADVERAIRLVDLAEYKRRQAPPGIKITAARVRARPAHADHQPLPRLNAATPACGGPGYRRRSLRSRTCVTAPYCSPRCARWRSAGAATRCRTSPIAHNIAREPDRRRRSPSTGSAASFQGLAITEATHDPERRLHRAVRQLPARRAGHVRAAAARHHLARQQLPARRRHAQPHRAHPRRPRRRHPARQDDRDAHRRASS